MKRFFFKRFLKQQGGSLAFFIGGKLWRWGHPEPEPSQTIQSITVFNLLRIGDTLVTLPTLEALRQFYPQAHITLVVRDLVVPLVKHLNFFDDLIIHMGDNSRSSCRRLLSQLPSSDCAFVLDTSPWVSWAARLAGAKRVIAYDSYHRAFAATDRLPAPPMWNVPVPNYSPRWQKPSYQGEVWARLAQYVGVSVSSLTPSWPVPQQAQDNCQRWLKEQKLDRYLVIHPGSDPSYRWPSENFRQIIQNLSIPIVVGGGPLDQFLCEEIATGWNHAKIWCHQGDLADYGALLSRAEHVLSVDTSAAHLAAAVGTSVTVLFGPGDPFIWAPRGDEVTVITATSDCYGCKAATCSLKSHECMESISVSTVLKSLKNYCL